MRVLHIGRRNSVQSRVPPGIPKTLSKPVEEDAVVAARRYLNKRETTKVKKSLQAQAMLSAALAKMTRLVAFFWDSEEAVWYEHDGWVWRALRAARPPLRVLIAANAARNIAFNTQGQATLADTVVSYFQISTIACTTFLTQKSPDVRHQRRQSYSRHA